jgi:hypothetical protein
MTQKTPKERISPCEISQPGDVVITLGLRGQPVLVKKATPTRNE